MTPIEIAEYKNKWMRAGNNHPIDIHSDLRSKAVDYCKVQLLKHQWKHQKYTDVYQDTFYFEHHQDANSFSKYFKDWVINH